MLPTRLSLSLGLFFFLPIASLFAESYYQGAGSTILPADKSEIRLVKLRVKAKHVGKGPCYRLSFRNALLSGAAERADLKSDVTGQEFAQPTKRIHCPFEADYPVFKSDWFIEAEYEVEPVKLNKLIELRFPVPVWTIATRIKKYGSELGNPLKISGVVNFEVRSSDFRYLKTELRWVDPMGTGVGPKDERNLSYVWKAAFAKKKKYVFLTRYEIGSSVDPGFQPGSDYLSSAEPWFMKSLKRWQQETAGRKAPAMIFSYYLSPANLWAPPVPNEVGVEIELSKLIPVTHVVPISARPDCVDSQTLHFRFKKGAPSKEFKFSYTEFVPDGLQNPEDWRAWVWSLMADTQVELPVPVSCSLVGRLKNGASAELREAIAPYSCSPKCPR